MAAVGYGARTEERRALLQRVLWSRQIERSTRIRDFLAYVCEKTFADPSVEIHEQEIGVKVFDRKPDYDTAADNVVRVTASQARRKLEQYFATDGASEPVILEIPKGQYTPVFRERMPIAPAEDPPSKRSRGTVILSACVIMLSISTIALGMKSLRRPELELTPALRGLWSQLLAGPNRTDIVVPDSSLSLFQELLDRQLTLAEYLNPNAWVSGEKFSSNPELRLFASRAAQRRFTSLASVTGVYRVTQLAGRDQSRISIISARDFNIRPMKSDNVVLLGSIRANPWMELIQDRLNFRFGFDQQSRYAYFDNENPQAGEARTYRADSGVSYCHIAFLPNLDRTGNVLVIAGTEIEGTEEGTEFVTNESSMTQLSRVAKLGRDGRMPYFEALLKSSRVGGVVSSFSIVGVRVLHF
jgi:hypothetical protein